ncbi:MAG: agmatinase [Anaerolineae bacterium]|nr:agmatinase [Anaerolineae bacterium]
MSEPGVSEPGASAFVRHPERFLGLDDASSARETSAAWVLPLPLDLTTSFLPGTRLGPAAIIEASNQVELYDALVDCEAASVYGVHTLPVFLPPASPREAFEAIADFVAALPLDDRLLVTLGGEHSLTPGVIRGLKRQFGYDDLALVQIDAHSDLRDTFDGTPYSHACSTRRALDDVTAVYQLGIRSVCEEEVAFVRENPSRARVWSAYALHRDRDGRSLEELREAITGRRVYLTLDVDGFDPSVISATGTPEPGGIGWYDGLAIIQTVCQNATVVAFDCVELSPMPGGHASAFAAAKLVYRTLNEVMRSRGVFDG